MSIGKILGDQQNTYSRVYDNEGMAKNIVEAYPYGIAHGLQKDAIQNGWDAMDLPGKKPTRTYVENNWSFKFILTGNSQIGYTLQMIDTGTTGLTGNLTAGDVEDNLPDGLDDDQKWLKFESWGIQGLQGDSLGSRGQGKVLFISASETKSIAYDSLRGDDSYRFGMAQLKKNSAPMHSCDEQKAKDMVSQHMGLTLLNKQGTRIIIERLKPDFAEEIRSGAFMRAIEDTWWPNILKYGAKISVEFEGQEHMAAVPEIYEELYQKYAPADTDERKFWRKDNLEIVVGRERERYKIKKIYLGYDSNLELSEADGGVSCFRGGMKVDDTIRFSGEFRDNAYGCVEFDQDLDQTLKQIEHPSHYGFRPEGVWKKVRKEIENQIAALESEKLSENADQRQKRRSSQSKDEKAALTFINSLTKDWGITGPVGPGGGPSKPPRPPKPPKPPKPIRVALRDFNFPSTLNRLDYGESIEDFYIEMINDTPGKFTAMINARIMKSKFISSLIGEGQQSKYILKPKSVAMTHALSLQVDREIFKESGEYRLLIELTEHKTGIIKDTMQKKFWVEEEPPLRSNSLFDMRPRELQDDHRQWSLEKGDRGSKWVVYYNTVHPSYQVHLGGKIGSPIRKKKHLSSERYLKEIALMAAIKLKLDDIVVNGDSYNAEQLEPFDADFLDMDLDRQFIAINDFIGSIRKQMDGEK